MIKIRTCIFSIVLIQCLRPSTVESANILSVFGLPVQSQYTFASSLLNALAERGHQITVITSFSDNVKLHSNIRKITIQKNRQLFADHIRFAVDNFGNSFYEDLQKMFSKGTTMFLNIIQHPQVEHILKTENFDLIILEIFLSEALYGLGEYFNAPMIGVSNVGTMTSVDKLVGNISPTSFIPQIFLQASFDTTFIQRCLNVAITLIDKTSYEFLYLPQQRTLYQKYFPNATLSFDKASRNFSLVLLNQHFSMSISRPYVPNMIEVAGLHIKEEVDILPKNIQQFLDDSPVDIIYIHLDNDFEAMGIKPQHILTFLKTFEFLNVKVIWNIDVQPVNHKSSNVLYSNNLSHFAIMAHPKVKLFIANGELISITEAIYYAKPILGIPIFTDQNMYIELATKHGYGLGLNLKHLNENILKQKILELLKNPQYSQKILELSKRFHDQPLKPKDRAIFWIEYVLRHNGATHLCSQGRFLNFWQYYNIDVYLAFFIGFVLLVFGAWITLKFVYFLIFKSKKSFKIKSKIN